MILKDFARRVAPRWMWRRLRAWHMQRMLASYRPKLVEHCYSGVRLKVQLADPLAQGWYDHDWDALPELDLLRQSRLQGGATVFDIGAHQGVVAMILASIVGAGGRVVAVEALAHNARLARRNAEVNGLANIHVECAAISDRPGELPVSLDLNARVGRHDATITTVAVPAITIDELSQRHGRPDVLLVDVEGFECRALRGAAKTLEHRPDCCVEVHVGCGLEEAGGSVAELFEILPVDYRFFAWTEHVAVIRPVHDPARCPAERFFLICTSALGEAYRRTER